MSKQFIFMMVIAGVILLPTRMARAHTLASDNGITAALHVEPDDAAQPGQPAELHVEFEDRQGVQLSDCACQLTVIADKKQLAAVELTAGPSPFESAPVLFTFPTKKTYSVIVMGVPKTAGAFPKFRLVYSVPIGLADSNEHQHETILGQITHYTHYSLIAASAGFILFLGFTMIRDKQRDLIAKT